VLKKKKERKKHTWEQLEEGGLDGDQERKDSIKPTYL
jgi:hypothetical protein